ncbi:hypothetical protein JKP88DRAFT_244917 [Tribonema minus]|uniref:Treble clef zinc finger domain-containing protein n=1 Tax=Tribonema minus TaxID=303371 RepID=A0A836CFL4_9STRA|nr:hypothetical protein JKP88DRAFT_244917 [Tribonema minus]
MTIYKPTPPKKVLERTLSLAHKRPDLAVDWSNSRNGFKADQITPGSPKLVWWRHKCITGCDRTHYWTSTVFRRVSSGGKCSTCFGKNKARCVCRDVQKRCSKCKITKKLASFHKDTTASDGYYGYCAACCFYKSFFSSLRGRARKHEQAGLGESTFDEKQYLKDMHGLRQSRCYYTCVVIVEAAHSAWQHSPQRLDTSNYSNTNTVPISLEINTSTGWTRAAAIELFTSTPEPMSDEELAVIRADAEPTECKTLRSSVRCGDDVQCLVCLEWKAFDADFYQSNKTECKKCIGAKGDEARKTWKGKFALLASSAKMNAATRRERGREEQVYELSPQILLEIIEEQRGLCAYSDKRVTTHGQWKMSLERRNVRIGYTRANSCLVLAMLNSTDFTASLDGDQIGNGGWNREKFEYARGVFQENYKEYYASAPPPSEGLAYA